MYNINKVLPMLNENGNVVKNQYTYRDDHGNRIFQSYDSVVALFHPDGQIVLDEFYFDTHSLISLKYRNMFLNMDTDSILTKVESGEILLRDLN